MRRRLAPWALLRMTCIVDGLKKRFLILMEARGARRLEGRTIIQPLHFRLRSFSMAEYRFCTVADEGRVRIVTINRPEVMNALHSEAHWEFDRVWNEFAADPELWVGIITGAGERAFSAGNDLKVQAAGRRGPRPATGFAGLSHRFDLDKPLIGAVNGVAMGGGFETALACDIIIAAENAVFALPEPRVGLIAGSGVHRLPRMIPQKQALGMILTGRRVSAAEGNELGFVNEVVPPGEALQAAKRWAALILECSPMAIRASKQSVYRSLDEPTLQAAMTTTYPMVKANLESQDYIEGPRAFAERRKPNWQNR
jgi:crotonobetainyl-CoA hydratase